MRTILLVMDELPRPLVMWELTRACSAGCSRCPGGWQPQRGTCELTTYEAYRTIDQIALLQPRELIITGGDPLERDDLYQLIDYARRRGLDPALSVSGTSLLHEGAIQELARAGLARIILGLDARRPGEHDRLRGGGDTFAPALLAARWAHLSDMAVEVNTLATPVLAHEFAPFVDLLEDMFVDRWNLFFLVPTKSSLEVPMLTTIEVETLFGLLDETRRTRAFRVRAFEAPHFGRYLRERGEGSRAAIADPILFINDRGGVTPGPFFPISAGDVRDGALRKIYEGSPLFVSLRNVSLLKGKCAHCEFRGSCGGSRARALAMAGDMFAADPLCVHQPAAS